MASGARMDRGGFWIANESTFETDPDSDGSSYVAVPVMDGPIIVDGGIEILQTDFAQSRARRTKPCPGPQKIGTVSIKVPAKGMATAAGDGTAASSVADDWLDLILANRFGSDTSTTGDAVVADPPWTPALTGIQFDSNGFAAQDLVPFISTNLTTRAMWRRLGVISGDVYPLDQNWDALPAENDVGYGSKNYRGDGEDGSSLSIVVEIDGLYTTLGGCRVSALSLTSPAGAFAFFEVTFSFSKRTINDTAKGAGSTPGTDTLPTLGLDTVCPIKGLLSPVMFNGSTLGNVAEVKIDWNPTTTPRPDRSQTNGRSDIVGLREDPLVSIKAAYNTQFETDHDAVTGGTLSVQLGAGALSGGVVNTCCFFAEGAHIEAETPEDNSGLADHDVQFRVHDAGKFTGQTDAHFWTFARA